VSEFNADVDWLAYHPAPSRPAFQLPSGAVDAHCHVFGPGAEFPFAAERKYTPGDAGKDALWTLRDHLGFARNVIVQATCHGADNRAMVDALRHADGRARGIATVHSTITDDELHVLDAAGVRGVRFNFVKRLVKVTPAAVLMSLAERIARLGWHLVIYLEAADLADYADFIVSLPTTVVFDHMARPDVSQPVDGDDFQRFVTLLQAHSHLWTKVTCPERLSISGPPGYDDFVPFARCLVENFPDRVLWGTDWPHPNMKSHMPDDGQLVDMIPRIATSREQQQQLLVDNPVALYWQR